MSAARPIHIPGATALTYIQQTAQSAVDAWAAERVMGWNDAERISPAIHVSPLWRDSWDVGKYETASSAAGNLWIRCRDEDRQRFGQAIVGMELMPRSACIDDWIAGVVDHAWLTRSKALYRGLFGVAASRFERERGSALPAEAFAFGSGAVMLTSEALGLHVIADGGLWSQVPPTQRQTSLPALTALDIATKRSSLRLDVMLGCVELEVPKLLDLRHGDVLRLPQRLDQPLAVRCEETFLAQAMLGELQGRKGVQLVGKDSKQTYRESAQ